MIVRRWLSVMGKAIGHNNGKRYQSFLNETLNKGTQFPWSERITVTCDAARHKGTTWEEWRGFMHYLATSCLLVQYGEALIGNRNFEMLIKLTHQIIWVISPLTESLKPTVTSSISDTVQLHIEFRTNDEKKGAQNSSSFKTTWRECVLLFIKRRCVTRISSSLWPLPFSAVPVVGLYCRGER